MVQAEYYYGDGKQDPVNDSIAGESSVAEAARPVPSANFVQEEHHAVDRQGAEQRSRSGNYLDVENRPPNIESGDDNQPQSAPNRAAAEPAASARAGISAASVRLRAAQLFPRGSIAPAAKPPRPAAAESPTNELITSAFDAAKQVALVRGQLAREEVVGYLVADALGVELLKEEALRLGENARKAAIAAKEGAQQLKNGASAKKSKLRKAAEKDAARAAGLDAELQRLDAELAAALSEHWSAPRQLAGLPDAKTEVFEARRQPNKCCDKHACAPGCDDDMCPRARALLDAAESPEATAAVKAAFLVFFLSGNEGSDSYFNENLEHAELKYKHALRRLKAAYPEMFCGFGERSHMNMMHWAARLEDAGHPMPAVQQAAKVFGIGRL